MKKLVVLALLALLTIIGFSVRTASAQEEKQVQKKEKPAAAAKEARWHGRIVRINKDVSSLDVKRGNSERKIYFDNSTQWTKAKKTVDMAEAKEGSDVICLGKFDEKGDFRASRIDIRD